MRIAVLVSGRGSNLQALIDARTRGELPLDIAAVASDRSRCAALKRASDAGIVTIALNPRDFPDRPAFDRALFAALSDLGPDLVILAGFMRILDENVVAGASWPMINIHPSLLPKYPGLDTHARALAAGDTDHGASVHVVIPTLDSGPVIAQARIAVAPGDTPDVLAQRLLPREHALLTATVRLIARRRLALTPAEIQFDGRKLLAPLQLDERDELHLDPSIHCLA